MKKVKGKKPVVLEMIIMVIGFLVAILIAGFLTTLGYTSEISGAVARIITGIIFLLIFHKCFQFKNSFKGFVVMLPILLCAFYKIPYHFISGGGKINFITVPIILIGLAPAIFEEVIFRGIFIYNLKKKYQSPITIVLISAFVFSLVHLTNLVGMDMTSVLIQVAFAMAVGIVLGAVYYCTQDIVSVMIAHFLIDVFTGIFPGGNSTPLYFLIIFIIMCCLEMIYGLVLLRKKKVSL